jgi:hypothetical protein
VAGIFQAGGQRRDFIAAVSFAAEHIRDVIALDVIHAPVRVLPGLPGAGGQHQREKHGRVS